MNKKVSVVSSAVSKLEYEYARKDLKVIFNSGKVYVYTPVSEELFNKVKNNESIGKFFNKHIRNNEALTCLKLIK